MTLATYKTNEHPISIKEILLRKMKGDKRFVTELISRNNYYKQINKDIEGLKSLKMTYNDILIFYNSIPKFDFQDFFPV